jgi:3-oxoacyl-[acyl-carrier protein] reductase
VIINIASVARSGNFGQSNYSAAKAGVSAMTVLWAQELAQYGIRVAGIAPGFTATEMVVSLRDDIKEKFTNSIPLRRFAETSEMSDGALFILKNEYYTGRMLEIDGGARI